MLIMAGETGKTGPASEKGQALNSFQMFIYVFSFFNPIYLLHADREPTAERNTEQTERIETFCREQSGALRPPGCFSSHLPTLQDVLVLHLTAVGATVTSVCLPARLRTSSAQRLGLGLYLLYVSPVAGREQA